MIFLIFHTFYQHVTNKAKLLLGIHQHFITHLTYVKCTKNSKHDVKYIKKSNDKFYKIEIIEW